MNSTSDWQYKNKALGMLLGLHCGDSLGATLEFGPPSSDPMYHNSIVGKGPFHWSAGAATDDTDLMILVLKSLRSYGALFDFDELKKNLIQWADSKPLDIGNTTKKGIENLRLNLPLRDCGFKHPTMYGNGSIMRSAPLAMYSGADFNEVLETQCLMTHGHQICVEIDRIYLHILQDFLGGNRADFWDFLKAKKTPKNSIKTAPIFDGISDEIIQDLRTNMEAPWDHLKTEGHAVWTLGAGFWALKQCEDGTLKPHEAVIQVANRGDDSDTCAAVAGALLGARYGVEVWPKDWLNIIQRGPEIRSLVDILIPG